MPDPYAPRARLADAAVAGRPLEVRWIDARGEDAPPAAPLGAALARAGAVMPPAMDAEGGSEGAGFLALRRGAQGTWLLMHRWAHGDIPCGRLARAEVGAEALADVPDRAAWLAA